MSIEALEQFYEKVRADAGLEAEAGAALNEGGAAVVALGAREGFEFSEDELSIALAQHATATGELSDADLDMVAGGIIIPPSLSKPTRGSEFGR
ncbi:putative ribosomally synthesized peptide with nif11-like leader [Mesorhizobium soli]|uniref:Nif11-like leader peptide family RiPP precursor n=1 Tax=Pseudaminobacter soli (ex Li et al. 2025) TaxID=1295366 RepID=UPI0024741A80|nr:Nif11-like leader peptide family RiPP precursor [Mesorhizobium soli]MDH6233104.1 putative ribosomally synthesized peptide with nif11-like leader [Mesorhizobium soli]